MELKLTKEQWLLLAGVALVAFGIGAAFGQTLAKPCRERTVIEEVSRASAKMNGSPAPAPVND